MELIVSSAIGFMTAAAVYLILQKRTFPIVVGLTLLSYAVNIFLFSSGRLVVNQPPIITGAESYTDPLPQALVLTAIVISFGMTALIVVLAIRGFLETATDTADLPEDEWDDETETPCSSPRAVRATSEATRCARCATLDTTSSCTTT